MDRTSVRVLAMLSVVSLTVTGLAGCLLDDTGGISRSEWAYQMTGLEVLYQKGYTGQNVTLAIVDTGIDMGHPEFKEVKLAGWKDFVYNREQPFDKRGHGSHVAGLIVAHDQLRGGAYNVNLLVAQVFPDEADSNADSEDIAAAIRWATDEGTDIITLSLGGGSRPVVGTETEDAVNEAIDKGVYVVAAAGNAQQEEDDGDDVKSPASVDRVIGVGAIDSDRRLAPWSEHGDNDGSLPYIGNPPDSDREDPHKKVELVAPGVEVLSAWKEGTYADASGTSQATPFVAAAIALLLEAYPEFKRANNDDDNAILQMKELLMDSAETLPGQEEPHDDGYGYGLLRADRAFEDWG